MKYVGIWNMVAAATTTTLVAQMPGSNCVHIIFQRSILLLLA